MPDIHVEMGNDDSVTARTMRRIKAEWWRNHESWCREEAAKKAPASWPTEYAKGYNDAMESVAEIAQDMAEELEAGPWGPK